MDLRKNPVSPTAVARARRMRREPTYPEYRLWIKLRARQIDGLYFRRQHPLGPHIIDFYCGQAKLAIEPDGVSHDERAAYDAQRSEFLNANGVRVIRSTDDEVPKNLDSVLHVIACECRPEE